MADDVDLGTFPDPLPRQVRRLDDGGFPTTPVLKYEDYQAAWFKKTAVDLQTKITEVSGEFGDLSGKVTEISSVVENEDGSLTAQRLTTVEAESQQTAGQVQDISAVVAEPDGTLSAGRLTSVEAQGVFNAGQIQDVAEVVSNPDGSLTAGRLTEVVGQYNGLSAGGRRSIDVRAGPGGVGVVLADQVSSTASGTKVDAGTALVIDEDGNSYFLIKVGQLKVQDGDLTDGDAMDLLVINDDAAEFGIPIRIRGQDIQKGAVTDPYFYPKQSAHAIYPLATGPAFTAFSPIREGTDVLQKTFNVPAGENWSVTIILNPAIATRQSLTKIAVFRNGNYQAPLFYKNVASTGISYIGTDQDDSGLQGSLNYSTIIGQGSHTFDIRISTLGNVNGQSSTTVLVGTEIKMEAITK